MSGLLETINRNEFVISVQIDPPGVAAVDEFKDAMEKLMKVGVTLVDVNSSRRISHDSIQLAVVLSQLGLEVIPHITTRDSSINGLLNQILASYVWGDVRNFLLITGDPYEASQAVIPSRGVFQTDSVGALKALEKHLRRNEKFKLPITLSASVNQNEPSLLREGKRIQEKERSGADFFMSQPIFSRAQAEHLFDFYHTHSKKPLLVGIWPLINAKTINVISKGRIVGVALPREVYNEAERRSDDEAGLHEWGLEEAYQLTKWIRESGKAQGVYIVAPTRNPLLLLDFLKKIIKS